MKTAARQSRHNRVRSLVSGTAERPRLVVFRGAKTISAQLIDDTNGTVLATVSNRSVKEKGATVAAATKVGTAIGQAAAKAKVTKAVFDRAGYAYHGQVKAVAEAAREAGLTI